MTWTCLFDGVHFSLKLPLCTFHFCLKCLSCFCGVFHFSLNMVVFTDTHTDIVQPDIKFTLSNPSDYLVRKVLYCFVLFVYFYVALFRIIYKKISKESFWFAEEKTENMGRCNIKHSQTGSWKLPSRTIREKNRYTCSSVCPVITFVHIEYSVDLMQQEHVFLLSFHNGKVRVHIRTTILGKKTSIRLSDLKLPKFFVLPGC